MNIKFFWHCPFFIVFCSVVAKRRDSSFKRNLNTPDNLYNQRLFQQNSYKANNLNKNNNTHSEE
jgi:hypothetical protein